MPSGRHPELPAPRAHLPARRGHRSLSDRQAARSPQVGAPAVGGATNATLRAHLHDLAAEVHELAASIHDWRAEEHAVAFRLSLGDADFHELWGDLRRTAAAAERACALKERYAAEHWCHHGFPWK
jgi:hypothetical protein